MTGQGEVGQSYVGTKKCKPEAKTLGEHSGKNEVPTTSPKQKGELSTGEIEQHLMQYNN